MSNYWRKVFAQAWTDTKQSFGWNQKTAATVLVAVVGLGGTFFQLGFAATVTSATGLLWTALPFIGAGFLLFIWNFLSAPAALHTQLSNKIAALEKPPPDYAAIRHIDRMTLREAAFYWCDLSPGPSMPSNVREWYGALTSAATNGELKFEPNYSGYRDQETEYELQKRNPQLDTIVTRKALQAFAKRHGYDPKFLRDA